MKNTIKFLTVVVAVFSFTFTSCDKIEELADVSFDTSMDGDFDLNFEGDVQKNSYELKTNPDSKAIDESMTIDLANNSSVVKYLNKLKQIKITKITYKVKDLTDDVNMNVGFYMNGNTIIAPQNYNLKNSSSVEYQLDDAAILETISTTLLTGKKVTFQLKGDYTATNSASAKVDVTIYFKVTANALQ